MQAMALLAATIVGQGTPHELIAHLQTVSVTIVARTGDGKSEGSGIIVTRRRGADSLSFVWTAAHVIQKLRKTRDVIDGRSGTHRTVVEFDEPLVVKSLIENGRDVGKAEFQAEVVRYSAEEDLALLRVRKTNFVGDTARFFLEEKDSKPVLPAVGTELWHVGSLLGQMGANSLTKGIVSQHGRVVNGKVYDQVMVPTFPGSSGGGIYLNDGRLVGMVLRGSGETFTLIAPIRRIRTWAQAAKVEWALNEAVAVPAEAELRRLPIEDVGATFTPADRTAGATAPAVPISATRTLEFRPAQGPKHERRLDGRRLDD